MQTNYKITNVCYFSLVIIISTLVVFYPPINILSYDVFGYYLYLPLTFKYHDLTIQNYSTITEVLNTYHASETFYQAVKWDNGNWVMRYPIGLSVLYSPFYFIADWIAPFTNYKADGFSRPYQLSILYSCLFYTLIGLHFIKKILIEFFNDKTAALTLLCVVLGTNYFFHVCVHGQGAMSHNILFSLYAIIIYFTIKWHKSYKLKHITLLAICIGLCALCRASEIICVLIPLFYGVTNLDSLKEKISILFLYKKQVLLFCFIIFCIGLIQLFYWKYSSNHFIINPYGSGNPGEGFELQNPHLLKVLFSFRKGWFVYTPIMIFVVFGFIYLHKKNPQLFLPILLYALLNIYIVSSWSCWWYGSCFSMRALIPSYAALCIPFGYFVDHFFRGRLKYGFAILFAALLGLNLFQSWQMTKGILDSTNMSRPYYFSTFLQTTTATSEQTKLLLKGKFNNGIEVFTKEDSLTHVLNYTQTIGFEKENGNSKFLCDTLKHKGKYSLILSQKTISSYSIEVRHETVTQKSYTWIKASVWVYSVYPADSLDAAFTIQLKHKGYIFKPKEYKLNSINFKQISGINWNIII